MDTGVRRARRPPGQHLVEHHVPDRADGEHQLMYAQRRRDLRDERGFTLIELAVAMPIMLIVMGGLVLHADHDHALEQPDAGGDDPADGVPVRDEHARDRASAARSTATGSRPRSAARPPRRSRSPRRTSTRRRSSPTRSPPSISCTVSYQVTGGMLQRQFKTSSNTFPTAPTTQAWSFPASMSSWQTVIGQQSSITNTDVFTLLHRRRHADDAAHASHVPDRQHGRDQGRRHQAEALHRGASRTRSRHRHRRDEADGQLIMSNRIRSLRRRRARVRAHPRDRADDADHHRGPWCICTVTQSENSNSRRDQTQSGAYQAAEAGTNAYSGGPDAGHRLLQLRGGEGRGDAHRLIDHVAHPNNCTVIVQRHDLEPASLRGRTWTYPTTRAALASDTGWYTIVTPGAGVNQEFQYLIQVYPAEQESPPERGAADHARRRDRPPVQQHRLLEVAHDRDAAAAVQPGGLPGVPRHERDLRDVGRHDGADLRRRGQLGSSGQGQPEPQRNREGEPVRGRHRQRQRPTYQNGATHYDKNTTPNALCKLNNCSPVPFTTFTNYIGTVKSAAELRRHRPSDHRPEQPNSRPARAPRTRVDVWQLTFNSSGTVTVKPCKDQLEHGGLHRDDRAHVLRAKNAPSATSAHLDVESGEVRRSTRRPT